LIFISYTEDFRDGLDPKASIFPLDTSNLFNELAIFPRFEKAASGFFERGGELY
jgi:hypothetical protein